MFKEKISISPISHTKNNVKRTKNDLLIIKYFK